MTQTYCSSRSALKYTRIALLIGIIVASALNGFGQCPRPGLVVTKIAYGPWLAFAPTAVADVNGDGKPDKVTHTDPATIKIALNMGDGDFDTPTPYLTGNILAPNFGDLNGDGKPEMLINDTNASTLDIWMNNGSGSFTFTTSLSHSGFLREVADFNGDGKGDLLSTGNSSGQARQFSIRIGNGAGSFTSPISYFVSSNTFNPINAISGDFNNDGKLDVAAGVDGVSPSEKVKVFINDGSGALTAATTTGITATELKAVVDLNNDGKSDIVGSPPIGNILTVMVNNGANSYTSTDYVARFHPLKAKTGDFDGDGKKDLFVYAAYATEVFPGVTVMFGDGSGAVTRADISKPGFGDFPADYDGDGKTDFLEGNNFEWPQETVTYLRETTCNASGDPRRVDFDGEGHTEFAVFRPSDGNWYSRAYSFAPLVSTHWGVTGDIPVPGDYDGDGRTERAVFRPSDGGWSMIRSSDQTFYGIQFGLSGDKPVPGDYDGDGRTDVAVYRPSGGAWYVLRSGSNTLFAVGFGISTDAPVPADFDGDLKTDIAVFRPSEGGWYIINSATNSLRALQWGTAGDRAVAADYDGDLTADVAVFRPSDGNWYVLRSHNSALLALHWGQAGDIPIAGFPGGLNTFQPPVAAIPVIYRPSTGGFYYSFGQPNAVQVGVVGDIPVSSPYTVE